MNELTNFIKSFRYAGLSPEDFAFCIPEMRKRNAEALEWLLPILIALLAGLFVVSNIEGSGEEANRGMYLVFAILLIIQYGGFKMLYGRHPDKVINSSYLLLLTALSFGIFQAISLGEDSSSISYCVMIVAVPMFIMDNPLRLSISMCAMTAIIIYLFYLEEGPLADQFVVINSISSTIIGICCCYTNQKTKFSDIINQLRVIHQRDTDTLTGAYSRTAYITDLEVMGEVQVPVGVIYADVNGLKKANDTQGHEAGDRLIRGAFDLMFRYFHNESDRIYRVGGDEFVILSVGSDKNNFTARCDAMNNDQSNNGLFSTGCVWKESINDTEDAIKEAEVLMYTAKGKYYALHPEVNRRMN